MKLFVHQIAVGGFDSNFSYLIYEEGGHAAVVDPAGDIDEIVSAFEKQGLTLQAIFITHTHLDHIEGIGEILRRCHEVPIFVHESGVQPLRRSTPAALIKPCQDNTMLPIGDGEVRVLHTPGHIDDAVCFFIETQYSAVDRPLLITGDTLFVEGCGRTNAANVTKLYNSLTRLANLPDETVVYPGHNYGPTSTSTIGQEKQRNRFLLALDLPAFIKERLG